MPRSQRQVDLRGGLHSGGDLGDGCTAAIGCVLNVVPAHALSEHRGNAGVAIDVFGAAFELSCGFCLLDSLRLAAASVLVILARVAASTSRSIPLTAANMRGVNSSALGTAIIQDVGRSRADNPNLSGIFVPQPLPIAFR